MFWFIIGGAIIGFAQGYFSFPIMRFTLRFMQRVMRQSISSARMEGLFTIIAVTLGSVLGSAIILAPMVLFSVLVLSQVPKSLTVDVAWLASLFLGVGVHRLQQKQSVN